MGSATDRDKWIRQRAEHFTNEPLAMHPVVWDDTTNYMSIERGHVVDLEGDLFLIRSNEHEGRFGIDDQPKFWVKRALSLDNGQMYELKLTCQEEFKIHVGTARVQVLSERGEGGAGPRTGAGRRALHARPIRA